MRAVALVGLVVLACGGGAESRDASPEVVVRAYFETLGVDPVRNLALLGRDFHASHGLRYLTTAEIERVMRGETRRVLAANRDEASVTTDGQRVAWLMVQLKPDFVSIVRRLSVEEVEAEISEDRAEVAVRVRDGDTPPFLQRFRLARSEADGAWRIQAIEQEGISSANLVGAIGAYPNAEHQRRLGLEVDRGDAVTPR